MSTNVCHPHFSEKQIIVPFHIVTSGVSPGWLHPMSFSKFVPTLIPY